jgi:hypothetical protein
MSHGEDRKQYVTWWKIRNNVPWVIGVYIKLSYFHSSKDTSAENIGTFSSKISNKIFVSCMCEY